MMIFEATCTRCWEKFNPAPSLHSTRKVEHDDPDTIWWHGGYGFTVDDMKHGEREDGTPCMGDGQLEGAWVA